MNFKKILIALMIPLLMGIAINSIFACLPKSKRAVARASRIALAREQVDNKIKSLERVKYDIDRANNTQVMGMSNASKSLQSAIKRREHNHIDRQILSLRYNLYKETGAKEYKPKVKDWEIIKDWDICNKSVRKEIDRYVPVRTAEIAAEIARGKIEILEGLNRKACNMIRDKTRIYGSLKNNIKYDKPTSEKYLKIARTDPMIRMGVCKIRLELILAQASPLNQARVVLDDANEMQDVWESNHISELKRSKSVNIMRRSLVGEEENKQTIEDLPLSRKSRFYTYASGYDSNGNSIVTDVRDSKGHGNDQAYVRRESDVGLDDLK